jgi:hypothetical protein
MAARDLWNMKKKGLLDQPNTFPVSTDRPQGPFPLAGGANGYILPAVSTPTPTWYLVVPPMKGKGFDAAAPESEWTVFSPYISQKSCQQGQAGWVAAKGDEHDYETADEVKAGKCENLARSDPRFQLWYLVIPPMRGKSFDAAAAESRRIVYCAYDTQKGCQGGQAGWVAAERENHDQDAADELKAGECERLPKSDPRVQNWSKYGTPAISN